MNDTLFLQDILNTPRSLEDTLAALGDQAGQLAATLMDRGARRFVALGNGSSLCSVLASIYLHDSLVPPDGTVAWEAPTGEYALYRLPLGPRDVLVGVSVSGEVVDLLDLLESMQGRHALVAITNVAGSSLTRLVEHTLLTRAGDALVPTATKAFATSVAALDLFWLGVLKAQGVTEAAELQRALMAIPGAVEQSLAQARGQIARAADRLAHCERLFVFGAGPSYGTAQEAALVFNEVASLPSQAVQAREMAQGMIAVADARLGVIAVNPPGRGAAQAREVLAQFAAMGAATLEVGPASGELCIDVECPDLLSPLVYSSPVFMLANELAGRRGIDTDHPAWEERYLRQVRRDDRSSQL